MNHLFANYELSLLAKEKGFNEDCLAYYKSSKNLVIDGINSSNKDIFFFQPERTTAPLYSQLVDWFREKHNILINVICYTKRFKEEMGMKEQYDWGVLIDKPNITIQEENKASSGYESDYYIALNKAIQEAFKLI